MAADLRPSPELTIEVFGGSSIRVSPPSETPAAGAIATEKLRGSCQACATSKVKCNKEKPTCSRCTRRGTPCQYWATKRPGRKRNRNQPSGRRSPLEVPAATTAWSGDFVEALMPEVVSPGQGQGQATTPPSSTPQWFLMAPGPGPTLALDVVQGLELGSAWPLHYPPSLASDSVFSTLASDTSGLAALAGLTTSQRSLTNPTDAPDAAKQSLDTASPAAAADIFPVFARNTEDSESSSHSRQTNLSSRDMAMPPHPSASSPYPLPDEPSLDSSPDACHVQALRLVRVCLRNRATKKPSCAKPDQQPEPLSPQAVAGENKRTIEAIQAVLGCACSAGDGAMLVMLCLAVLMVLDAYTVAAQRQDQEGTEGTPRTSLSLANSADQSIASSSSSSPRSRSRSRSLSFLTAATTPISHTSTKEPDRHLDRMVAQLILGELHRVQRVAKEIAGRLEGYHDLCASHRVGVGKEVNVMSLGDEAHVPFFFSATTCKEMAKDLRERVSALAKSLIETLRKG